MPNFAVIGLGHWGPNHVRVFHSLPECAVIAAADSDAGRLEKARHLAPGLQAYTDYRELLANDRVDAIVIATPVSSHFEIAAAALMANKHVLCEKPLCRTAAEARELGALAEKAGRILMTGHIFLFNAGIRKLKQLLNDGELGDPNYLTAVRTNLGPIRRDVNASYDLASHDVSIFNWLLGSVPTEVHAMGTSILQPGIDDVVIITLRYPGNVLASIQCSWLDPRKVRQITMVGSRKMVTWDDLNLTSPIAIYEKGAKADLDVSDYGEFLRVTMWEGDIRLPKVAQAEPLRAQAEYFVQAIREGRLELSAAAFSTGVIDVLERVDACLRRPRL